MTVYRSRRNRRPKPVRAREPRWFARTRQFVMALVFVLFFLAQCAVQLGVHP